MCGIEGISASELRARLLAKVPTLLLDVRPLDWDKSWGCQ